MAILTKLETSWVGTFLEGMKLSSRDDVTLRIHRGIMTIRVKRSDGRIQSDSTAIGGPSQRLNFDPSALSPAERPNVARRLRREGHRQRAIARLLGVSQATFSLDLRKWGPWP